MLKNLQNICFATQKKWSNVKKLGSSVQNFITSKILDSKKAEKSENC